MKNGAAGGGPAVRAGSKQDGCAACPLGRVAPAGTCPFHEVKKEPGEFLVHQNETSGQIWFVKQGEVVLSSMSAAGDEHSSAVRGPGRLIGLEALLHAPAQYQARALTHAVLCEGEVSRIERWMGDPDSPMGAMLALTLGEASLRGAERQALEGSALARVARFLLDHMPAREAGERRAIPQHVMAQMLGMRAETLSRTLAQLRKEGVIDRGRSLRILDAERLGAMAEAEG